MGGGINSTPFSNAVTTRNVCFYKVGSDDDDVELNVLGCLADILGTNCDQCVCMVQCCFTSTETIRLIRTAQDGHFDSHTAPEL